MNSTRTEVMALLKKSMRPEFLNRVDEVIMFEPLSSKHIHDIVKLQLNLLQKQVLKQDIKLTASDDVIQYISEKGFDPQFGARPIKRLIQKEVLNSLSKALLAGEVEKGQDVVMDVFDNQIVFRKPIKKGEKLQKA